MDHTPAPDSASNTPQPGYWAKLAVGKAPPKPALPPTEPGDETSSALIPLGRISREGYYKPRKRLLPDIITSEKQLETIVRLANKLYRHQEARGHRVRLSNAGDRFQRQPVEPRPAGKQSGYYDSLWQPERPTVVYIDGVAIGPSLFETLHEQEMQYVRGEYVPVSSLSKSTKMLLGAATWTTRQLVPSGEFCLQAYSPYPSTKWIQQWRGTSGALGELFGEIADTLQAAPPAINALVEEARLAAEKWQREWKESMARRRREEQAKRRAAAIAAARAELLAIIEEWNESKRIAAFFEEVLAQRQRTAPWRPTQK